MHSPKQINRVSSRLCRPTAWYWSKHPAPSRTGETTAVCGETKLQGPPDAPQSCQWGRAWDRGQNEWWGYEPETTDSGIAKWLWLTCSMYVYFFLQCNETNINWEHIQHGERVMDWSWLVRLLLMGASRGDELQHIVNRYPGKDWSTSRLLQYWTHIVNNCF